MALSRYRLRDHDVLADRATEDRSTSTPRAPGTTAQIKAGDWEAQHTTGELSGLYFVLNDAQFKVLYEAAEDDSMEPKPAG